MKFITMKKPLKYAVCNGSKIMIPKGEECVQIAFEQSHLVRNYTTGYVYPLDFSAMLDSDEHRLNVYRRYGSRTLIHA